MIELGYMAKRIALRPAWLDHPTVRDIYAVSGCVSNDFCDYINYWAHNGFWFFDSPAVIRTLALENNIDRADTVLLYYRGYEQQFDAELGAWTEYGADPNFVTGVIPPSDATRLGFDIVTYSLGNAPECSPLSCNYLAKAVEVNEHCLIDRLDYAIAQLKKGVFNDSEPGPYRIIEVNSVSWHSCC